MSRQSKVVVLAAVCFMAIVVLIGVAPIQAGKTSSPILSLKANFEAFWINGSDQFIATRIHNDIEGFAFTDAPDTKKVAYGVEVKYYPPANWDYRGRFVMKLDRTKALGRFVQLSFGTPSTDPTCDDSGEIGCGIDPLRGGTGTIETKTIEITTQIVLVRNNAGELVRDVKQPIGMELMKTGDSKFIGLGITFTPNDPAYAYRYDLGQFTDPENYDPNVVCQENNYQWGTAELYCVQAGQVWEFRPYSEAFPNDPDNLTRLLDGHVLVDYWKTCKLRKWTMPFVLRVAR